jgi:hypothetical protein
MSPRDYNPDHDSSDGNDVRYITTFIAVEWAPGAPPREVSQRLRSQALQGRVTWRFAMVAQDRAARAR